MKLFRFFPVLAFMAVLSVSCGEGSDLQFGVHQAGLTVSPSAQKIAQDGTASFSFNFNLKDVDGMVKDVSKYTATVSFEATGGTVSPSSATTDASGNISVVFTTPDPEGFTGGTVKGTIKQVKEIGQDGLFQQGDLATATADVLPLNAKDTITGDEAINKAEELDDNTYVIQKKGGEIQTFPLSQQDSRWYVGRSYTDRTQQAIKVELMDEDPVESTMGWGMAELPLEIANKLITINQEFYQKYPWANMKFGSFRTGKEVSAHMGSTGGNVKQDGKCQIWLKEKTGVKSAYTGQYQFLFVFVFTNQTWDSNTQTYVTDDEYTIYGNAVVEQDFPELSYFSVSPASDWVQVGKTVAVDVDWSDGADFDMSKIKLVGQTKGYSSSQDEDEGYFRWDASTLTLTSLKSSNDEKVYLKFRYEGTELGTTCQVATGPGWEYTSFSFNPARLVMDKYGVMALNCETYAPTNVMWHWNAIEIDPETNPDGAFYFDNSTHKLYNFSAKPGQTYNLRFRVRNDHSVTASLEVYVVEQTPYSFTITYYHNNDYINDDNIHGVCNYGMGLSLGVITNPVDCYWNWADVELIPGYDDGFSFSGTGGRDDHPKLIRTRSNPSGTTSYGVQMGFRLKYDHSKTCYIYIDHN